MKYLFSALIIFVTSVSHAQEKGNSIAISYGFGNGTIGSFKKLDGSGSEEGKSLHKIGVFYINELSKSLYFETGINYINFKYISTAPFYGQLPVTTRAYEVKLISVPLMLRFDVGKYFFINGGILADIDVSKKTIYTSHNFTGLGAGLGLGVQYPFSRKLSIYTNPRADLRNILSFSSENHSYFFGNMLIDFGLKFNFK